MWADASGQLGETEISELESLARKPVLDEWPPGTRRFITNLCEFNRLVTLRYRSWLESLPWHQREQVHAEILGGMLTGKLRRLVATLDAVGSRRGMFKHYFKRSDF